MKAFERASSGACDPIKIQKWIRRWMDDGPATGEAPGKKDEMRCVELLHDADKQVVSSWDVTRKTNIQQLANEIAERATEDAKGLGDERARYLLQPYFGQSGSPNGRATFFVTVADPYPEGGDDGTGLTEGPSPKGMTTMLMRHTNEAVTLALGGAKHGLFSLGEENQRLRDECATLRQELRDLGEKVRQYENESFERAIKWRKTLFWEKAREEALKQVIPFVGMVGGAVLSKIGMLGMGGQSGALPPAKPPAAAAPPVPVTVAPGTGFPVHPPAPPMPPDVSDGTANGGLSPTAGGPPGGSPAPAPLTIEGRLRRLWKALHLPQKMALPMALAKHPSIGPLQKAAAQKVVELLMAPEESPRAHPEAVSLLELQASGLFGTFTDKSWTELMTILLNEARWTKEQVAILTGIVRDLGRRDQAFDASIAAPMPAPPEPVVPIPTDEERAKQQALMGPGRSTPKDAYDPVERTAPAQPATPAKPPVGDTDATSSRTPGKASGKASGTARGKKAPAMPRARAMPALPSRRPLRGG